MGNIFGRNVSRSHLWQIKLAPCTILLVGVFGEEIRGVIGSFGGRHPFSPFDVLRQERQEMTWRQYDVGDCDNDITWHDWMMVLCTTMKMTHDTHTTRYDTTIMWTTIHTTRQYGLERTWLYSTKGKGQRDMGRRPQTIPLAQKEQHGDSSVTERQLTRLDLDSTLSDWRHGCFVPASTILHHEISHGPSLIQHRVAHVERALHS